MSQDESGPGSGPGTLDQGRKNAIWAETFLDGLVQAGVRHICVAPGSRSTPLVLAAARDPRLHTLSILDERSAGFFALGLGRATKRPAAVVTTSGTAAANLYPAVIEASQAEVPLLALTADRPHRLRDADANQTMDQSRLFGTFPRAFLEVPPVSLEVLDLRHLRMLAGRAVTLASESPAGPVHLNFPFRKPLEPARGSGEVPSRGEGRRLEADRDWDEEGPSLRVVPGRLSVPEAETDRLRKLISESGRGLIVAGPVPDADRVGAAVRALGAATGFPILADPLSGARFGPSGGARVVAGYDLFLRSPEARKALAPRLILRVGASPTSAAVLDLMAESDEAIQVVIDDGHRWKDHLATADAYVRASPAALCTLLAASVECSVDAKWREAWDEAEARTRGILEPWRMDGLMEGQILACVANALPEGANLVVASSMPIRDLDAFAPPSQKTLQVFGNRGVSGIDGLVSTTLGVGLGQADRLTVGVLGDLAFLHDMNGLLAMRTLGVPVVFVVVNNDGGGIFHTLPVRHHEPAFTRFFATPHGLDLRKAAELYGIPYTGAASLQEFERCFQEAVNEGGPALVEVRTRREETHASRQQVVAAVIRAMEDLDVP